MSSLEKLRPLANEKSRYAFHGYVLVCERPRKWWIKTSSGDRVNRRAVLSRKAAMDAVNALTRFADARRAAAEYANRIVRPTEAFMAPPALRQLRYQEIERLSAELEVPVDEILDLAERG